MDNLFLDKEELIKEAKFYVTRDKTTWVKAVITELLRKFPEFSNFNLSVEWKKMDVEKGYAVGAVFIDQVAVVPIIMENFAVYDLDILIVNDATLPLTHDVIMSVFQNPQAFKANAQEASKTLDNMLFAKSLTSPESTDANYIKQASILDKIDGNVNEKDVDNLLYELKKSAHEFIENDMEDLITKVSSLKTVSENDFAKDLVRGLEMDRQYSYKDENGNYIVKQASSKINYVYSIPVSAAEAQKCPAKVRSSLEKVSNFIEEVEKAASLEAANAYLMDDGRAVYLTKESNYSILDENTVSKTITNFEPEGTDPKLGDVGMWVLDKKASLPFEVLGLQKVAGAGNYEIVGWDGINKVAYYPVKGLHRDEFIPHELLKSALYVPGNGKFVKLANKMEVDIHVEISGNHYLEKDAASLYSFSGPEFEKYGKIKNLGKDEAIWTAIHCNATEDEAEKIASLEIGEVIKFASVKSPQSLLDVEYEISKKYNDSFLNEKKAFLKLAKNTASFADKTSVDAVLALALMNKNNIMEYAAQLEHYEMVMSSLAKLLLANRLGLKGLNEYTIKNAMASLSEITVQLRGLTKVVN